MKPQRKPIYFVVVKGIDSATGEECGMLRPLNRWDQRAMRERGYTVGTEVRAELKKPRNVKFHRLAHAFGAFLVDNSDAFIGLTAHNALKKLQSESGAECDFVEYEIPGLGKITRNEPHSLAFDEMDEGTFQMAFKTMFLYASEKYMPTMTPEAIELAVQMYEVQH